MSITTLARTGQHTRSLNKNPRLFRNVITWEFCCFFASMTSNRIIILSTHIIGNVEAVTSRLLILQEGHVLTDTMPEALLALAAGSVYSVTTNQATALQFQASYQVSKVVNQMHGITLRIVSATHPHKATIIVDPSLEEASLSAVGRLTVRI